jgi:class 3 adenylate cyclase
MAEERAQRHLAAILAADVVGYTRLMEQDEADTFARLKAHRKELFEPEIERHQGRVFKLMGDGLLAEFGSVVDAVECAVVLQRGMAERNNGVPEDRRIDIRGDEVYSFEISPWSASPGICVRNASGLSVRT